MISLQNHCALYFFTFYLYCHSYILYLILRDDCLVDSTCLISQLRESQSLHALTHCYFFLNSNLVNSRLALTHLIYSNPNSRMVKGDYCYCC